jgi:hypothetical protein
MRTAHPGSWVLPLLAACSPVQTLDGDRAPTQAAVPVVDDARDLLPSGLGSLRQDEFSLEIVDGGLHVKVTPLTEPVIRLAAPDTYERLHALARSRTDAATELTEGDGAELFLVSFFSRDPNVEYRPEELQIGHRGRTLRPAGIVPLTSGWGRHLLQPQQTQSAIYVFEPPFDYALPMAFRYGLRQNDEWHRTVVPRLDEERTRVLLRAAAYGT